MTIERPVTKIGYTIIVDSNTYQFVTVKMSISNIADRFQVAMVRHPEYDDQYWRYVSVIRAYGKSLAGKVTRKDSALWEVRTDGGEALLEYRIDLPAAGGLRDSWKAFLSKDGGLIGGAHCFLYILNHTMSPCRVTVIKPAHWKVSTGLRSASAENEFLAHSAFELTDAPIMIGNIKEWKFIERAVPHHVAYLGLPSSIAFDTLALVTSIQKLVREAGKLFNGFPYEKYYFLLQDGALSSLEHNNSVVVGAPSDQLATGFDNILPEIAHEYLHAWNLVRIKPAAYGDVSHKEPLPVKEYWFSEGLTLFYADLLSRRAGLPVVDSTRLAHLGALMQAYTENPAYTCFSAEEISMSSYAPIGFLGNHTANTHLQGEVIGYMLDMLIRSRTSGKKNMDDVMRWMMDRFNGRGGFTSRDVQMAVGTVCGCDAGPFFRDHVFGKKKIDFNQYLQHIGLSSSLTLQETNEVDLSIYISEEAGATGPLRLVVTRNNGTWSRMGIKTGDELLEINFKPASARGFYQALGKLKIGDSIRLKVKRDNNIHYFYMVISAYIKPQYSFAFLRQSAKATEIYHAWKECR